MEKKRILQVVGGLDLGGVQNVVMNLYRYIDREKYEFHFVVFGNERGKFEKEVEQLGGEIHRINQIKNSYLKYLYKLIQIMKKNGPFSVVHTHLHLNNGVVLLASKIAGIPNRIVHAHSIKRVNENNGIIKKTYEFIMKILIKKYATKFLACSLDAGNYLYGEKKFKERGVVLPNSIDLERFSFSNKDRKRIRKELNIENELILGNIGRLSKVKNQTFVIDVLESLLRSGTNARLLIIGDGEEKENLINYTKIKDLQNNVIFLGSKNDISVYLSAMDVFIFPSLYEGLGISIIESQANGLATVISNTIPREAIFNQNVHIMNLSSSAEKWGEKILSLNYAHIEKVNLEFYKHGYDVENLGVRIDEIYQ